VAWHYADNTELVDRVCPEHRNYLRSVADSGRLRASDPVAEEPGGEMIAAGLADGGRDTS
jgi:uncharacterized protein YciI